MEKFYITTPIYYASNKPHIGHALTMIYADVLVRHNKISGKDVFFAAGLDEHGAKIAEKAEKEKKKPQDFVNEIADVYIGAWERLELDYSEFIRTTSSKHKEGLLEFVKTLAGNSFSESVNDPDIYLGEYEGLYCVGCENFILERSLVDGLCPDHKTAPRKIKEENYFFNLKKYLPEIRKKIESGEIKITPESRKNETLGMLQAGMPDFSITRESVEWGVRMPGSEKQTIYVWADALANYFTILGYPNGDSFKKYWPPDLQIIGADINKFHTVYWIAMLLATKLPLPKEIFVHGLFTVNGQKMSKTIGNVVDPMDMIDKFGADAVRYLLLSQFPASEHGDVKAEEFTQKYNSDLANGVGNLFERSFTMALDFRGGVLDDKKNIDEKIKSLAEKTEKIYNNNMEKHKLYEALAEIFVFIKSLDVYINEEKPWVLNKNSDPRLDAVLATLLFGAEKIIGWLEPFMPVKMETAKNHLSKLKKGELKKGDKLGLFPRI